MAKLTLRHADPADLQGEPLVFAGCGIVGARAAVLGVQWGAENVILVDHKVVAAHNVKGIRAQVYRESHVGRPKVDCLAEILREINPNVKVETWNRKLEGETDLPGYVFSALDTFNGRGTVCHSCIKPGSVSKLLIEQRMGDVEARVFFVDLGNEWHKECYADPENWKSWDTLELAQDECGESGSNLALASISAVMMLSRLWMRLLMNRGYDERIPNDTVFWLEPLLESHSKYW